MGISAPAFLQLKNYLLTRLKIYLDQGNANFRHTTVQLLLHKIICQA